MNADHRGESRDMGILLCVLGAIGLSVPCIWWVGKERSIHQRTEWKETAIRELTTLSITNEEINREITNFGTQDMAFNWVQDQVLQMTNGEYIIFAFRHGEIGSIDHLFLGHASDGRWLYSTFHFCTRMAALMGETAPGSIAEFEKRYSVREFDGKSDICLRHTWPPH